MHNSRQTGQKVIVTQLGARNHYAAPLAFFRAGMLHTFHTDIWTGGFLGKTLRLIARNINSKELRKWAGRYCQELSDSKVKSHSFIGYKYAFYKRQARSLEHSLRIDLLAAKSFCETVAKNGLDQAEIVYCVKDAKEIFEVAEDKYKVLEQVDCPRLYWKIRSEEVSYWRGWEEDVQSSLMDEILDEIFERDRFSQVHADKIIAPSEFVLQYLISEGINPSKVEIVPYGFDFCMKERVLKRYDGRRKLRILYVGAVNLMKGIPYLLKALDVLSKKHIEVCLVGPILIKEKIISKWREKFNFIGMVPRSNVKKFYEWADIFVFPSLCEGSALVQYEALSFGLPIVTTFNSGSIVIEGEQGFVLPIRDSEAIANSITKFLESPELIIEMSQAAFHLAAKHTMEHYAKRLVEAIIN
jgi:glycosyltransferase involved in cell wall biosynthesis